ncbi:MAG: hypothetical protein JSU70_22460 [Phycisphaerales bacterium]|nr:MAG: hypothetical protein JSU70_22460 [Phycisphaerales bacterium]
MIVGTLALWTPGPVEVVFILAFWALPALVVVWIVRHVLRSDRERLKLRLEVGKLADELEQMRKQKDSQAETGPSAVSD